MVHKLVRVIPCIFVVIFLVTTGFTTTFAKEPIPGRNASEFEVRFMKDMINHHQLAILEAEKCLEEAISTLLQRRCEKIIVLLSQQIRMMQSWLRDWYGIDYQPQRTRAGLRKLEKLEGAVFEMRLMDIVIKHNRQVVRVTEKCFNRAYHPELLAMCQNIAAAQTTQIERMQEWLCDWWLVCRKYN